MTEEQLKAKKIFAGEKKASMKRRDDNHDYTERRMYMITLEVEGRHPVFGHLVGDPFAERGSPAEARIELSALGRAVEREWLGISRYFPQIEVKAVQMMPDHMHGILFVREPLPVHLGQVISGFKAGCRKAQRALAAAEPQPTEKEPQPTEKEPQPTEKEPQPTEKEPQPTTEKEPHPTEKEPQPTEKEPHPTEKEPQPTKKAEIEEKGQRAFSSQQVKALPSQERQVRSQPFLPLFAKGYNDLILRSYDELPTWQNYLRDNPRRLLMKRARPDWLRPFFGLRLGTQTYSGIGNRQLLSSPKRMAVRVSRRFTDSKIVEETARYLEAAREGAILVSPAISPGEKLVMRAAFDEGMPIIVIMENGFTPLSKPHGEQFDACAQGRLLMLAPWEHHNDKRKITSEQCQQLNLMALEICNQ